MTELPKFHENLTSLQLFRVMANRFKFRTYEKAIHPNVDIEIDITWGFKLVCQFNKFSGEFRYASIVPSVSHRDIFWWVVNDVIKMPARTGRTAQGSDAIVADGHLFSFNPGSGQFEAETARLISDGSLMCDEGTVASDGQRSTEALPPS